MDFHHNTNHHHHHHHPSASNSHQLEPQLRHQTDHQYIYNQPNQNTPHPAQHVHNSQQQQHHCAHNRDLAQLRATNHSLQDYEKIHLETNFNQQQSDRVDTLAPENVYVTLMSSAELEQSTPVAHDVLPLSAHRGQQAGSIGSSATYWLNSTQELREINQTECASTSALCYGEHAPTEPVQPSLALHQHGEYRRIEQLDTTSNQEHLLALGGGIKTNEQSQSETCLVAATDAASQQSTDSDHRQPSHTNALPSPEKVIQRSKANKKERRRTQSINQAFSELRRHIPDVPTDTKLSKIKTLRLAISYINHLAHTLTGESDIGAGYNAGRCASDAYTTVPVNVAYESSKPASSDFITTGTVSVACARNRVEKKHRTGWPEIVWSNQGAAMASSAFVRVEHGPGKQSRGIRREQGAVG